jgi:hypothetical protein
MGRTAFRAESKSVGLPPSLGGGGNCVLRRPNELQDMAFDIHDSAEDSQLTPRGLDYQIPL